MKKFYLIFFAAILFFNYSPLKAQLAEHLEAGKRAYLQYADKAIHEQIKASKTSRSYAVGDTATFWRWNLTVMPPLWVQENARCCAVGDNSYVFVALSQWGSYMTQAKVDTISKYLEDATFVTNSMGIIEMDTMLFGPIPDELDNDPRVIFYFTNLGSFMGTVFDGYFSSYNQMTEAEAQQTNGHSNECEMVYMSCNPTNPVSNANISVLSHELEHLIHFGIDPDEEQWVDEGCAGFAMVMFGYPDPIADFPDVPNNNLLVWDQEYSDYVQTYLFMTYLAEQTTGPAFIKEMVANQLSGTDAIDDVLSSMSFPLDFQEILTNWTIANYVDDTSFLNGEYGYVNLNLPQFSLEQTFSTIPAMIYSMLDACAAHYYKLTNNFNILQLDFSLPNGGEWEFTLLAYENNDIKEIIKSDDAAWMQFKIPTSYTLTNLILVVTNKEISANSKEYIVWVDEAVGIDEGHQSMNPEMEIYPNPVNDFTEISLNLHTDTPVDLRVIDASGRSVIIIFSETLNAGHHSFNLDAQKLSGGTYFVFLNAGNYSVARKIIMN